ncbi:MAG: dTDP-4-dehydrorhamnose reductase [Candidatus Omnitrophota bacterium]|nr:MAG: dTDP-4-dehydrorhamnose reductase [Candidatus Omnitrophota bacterium]
MLLVTGAEGMVGSYLREVFSDTELYLTDIDNMDVTNFALVEETIKKVKPSAILHLAAETDVDHCQQYPDKAFKVNVFGTQNVAMLCRKYDILLVYVSTAGVFGGDKREPYTEFDTPNPVNIYGLTKLEGERLVERILYRYFIVRAGWMIGGEDKDKKFVGKMIQLMRERKEIRVVYDKIGSPTFAKYLLLGIKKLMNTQYYGLYHMTCKGVCSRYDIALEIAKIMKKDIKITPVSSAFFPLPAPRAYSEAMRNYKLDLLGMNDMPTWQEALKEYLSSWITFPK